MRSAILFLFALPALAANYANEIAVKLDAGATSFTLTNSGSVGGTISRVIGVPGSWARTGVVISPIFVAPTSATTYTTCADPCGVGGTASLMSMNRQWGQQYIWIVRLDSGGSPIAPFTVSAAGGAYVTNSCNGAGTLPQVEFPTITTAPLPMPIPVIGQDCYVTRFQLPVDSGHTFASHRLYVRIHNPAYNNPSRPDGKASFQINGNTWITLTNSAATAIDEQRYYGAIGSFPQTREFTLPIPDGTILVGDTTVTIGARFNGTDGNTSGYSIEAIGIIEADKSCTSLAVVSNVTTITCAANGLTNGNTVLIQNAPGMYMRHNGLRTISNKTTNTFDYTPCGTGTTGCTSPNATGVAPPAATNPTGFVTAPGMYAARSIIPKSAFTDWVPDTAAPAGGDATRGGKLWKWGNDSSASTDQLVNPVLSYFNSTLHNATCGGATGCHTSTGSDLKVFNYSNVRIRERSKFHGLTDQDGDDIAAYIRGLPIGVPSKGRPWNPPMQPGPLLSNIVWPKSTSALTSIQVTSNVAIATFPADPGLLVGEPICVTGATVDTDLNGCYAITAIAGTYTATFTTASVGNATYTESTLIANASAKFFAGCGIDCVLTYGQDICEYLDGSSDCSTQTNFHWNQRIEPRNIPINYQLADWNKGWTPVVHPADGFPQASTAFFSSAGYTNYRDIIDNMTPSNFTSFAAHTYGKLFYSNQTNQGFWSYIFETLCDPSPGVCVSGNYANWSTLSYSIMQYTLNKTFEVLVDKNVFCMDGQRIAAEHGGSSTPNPDWPISCGFSDNVIFETAFHKIHYDGGAGSMNTAQDVIVQSNAWYVAQVPANGGNGWDQADSPIDQAYLAHFLKQIVNYRPSGAMAQLYAQLFVPQVSASWPEFSYYLVSYEGQGTDWAGWFQNDSFNVQMYPNYYLSSLTQWRAIVNTYLKQRNVMLAAHDATYWNTIFVNKGWTGAGCCDANTAWGNIDGHKPGAIIAMELSLFTMWGADATELTNLYNFGKSIPGWVGFEHFDDNVIYGSRADQYGTAGYGTGNLTSAGSGKTITYVNACPSAAGVDPGIGQMIITDGTDTPDLIDVRNTTGTCAARGGSGTIVVTTAYPHTGAWKALVGLSAVLPYPNYNPTLAAGTIPYWFRTARMF